MKKDERLIAKIRQFLNSNIGRLIEEPEMNVRFGVKQWPHIVNMLAEHEGLDLVLFLDEQQSMPKMILLKSGLIGLHFEDTIPTRVRRLASKPNILSCKMCGRENGEQDPTTQDRRIRLFVTQLMPASKWTGPESQNIESTCIACVEGLATSKIERPTSLRLKSSLRRASTVDQLDILSWLIKKYPYQSRQMTEQ